MTNLVIEHGETAFSRRLRRRRLQLALAIAAVEAILVLAGLVPWWLAVAAAVASVAAYLLLGRDHRSAAVRSVTWVAAVSQLTVVLVPVAVVLVGVLVLVVLVALMAGVLVVLFLDRR
jgi:hypothetical protein